MLQQSFTDVQYQRCVINGSPNDILSETTTTGLSLADDQVGRCSPMLLRHHCNGRSTSAQINDDDDVRSRRTRVALCPEHGLVCQQQQRQPHRCCGNNAGGRTEEDDSLMAEHLPSVRRADSAAIGRRTDYGLSMYSMKDKRNIVYTEYMNNTLRHGDNAAIGID